MDRMAGKHADNGHKGPRAKCVVPHTSAPDEDVTLEHGDPSARLRKLSPRELETFNLIVNGRTTKEISSDLGISQHTADHYRRRVYEKLSVQGIVDIVRYAARVGWFSMQS